MSKKSKLLSLGAVAISVAIIVMFIQGTSKKSVPDIASDGRPHYVIALYDESYTDTPHFKVDAIYRVIKDSVIILSHNSNTANVKAYKDTSYFVMQDIPVFDKTGKRVKDSTQKGYVNINIGKILLDGGQIDTLINHYKPAKK